jgi:hypothetical protein
MKNYNLFIQGALASLLMCCCAMSAFAGGKKETITFNVTRAADSDASALTSCGLNAQYVALKMGCLSVEELNTKLSSKDVVLIARQGTTDTWYTTASFGSFGHTFSTKGYALASSTHRNAALMSKFENNDFLVGHIPAKVTEGTTYSFLQAFVSGTDTLAYQFNVTIGQTESVESDQPSLDETFVHRADATDSWVVTPLVRQNEQTPLVQNYIQVNAGDDITLSATLLPQLANSVSAVRFRWYDAKGSALSGYSSSADFAIADAEYADGGQYELKVVMTGDKSGIYSCIYYVDVQTEAAGVPFDWSANTPKFGYDFRSEYPELAQPTKIHKFKQRNGKYANYVEGEWWVAYWGDDLNPAVDFDNKNAYSNMIKKFDEDFAYIRNNMGWPPDINAREGYKSFIYTIGSGINKDNTDSVSTGGWQSSVYIDGRNWPCVWATWYPMSRFRDDADNMWNDGDYQREAMIHEGIHALFADMSGVKGSAWFHEAGNTWLQSAMTAERNGSYGTPGFLDACPLISPFMPIECYSGWLQDGSFGGPAAEGVNMYDNKGKQVCTWRTLLGGNQYGNSFPIVLGEICGKGSIPWIWRYCKNRVLEGIGDSIGEEPMRQLILQYRARQAMFDFGGWSKGYRQIVDNNFGGTIGPEYSNGVCSTPGGATVGASSGDDRMACWIKCDPYKLTPYVNMYRNTKDGWLAPDTITNPGWSGANVIPIHVTGDVCKVEFRPEDSEMRAQLCYRTKSGKAYYSQPVRCGTLTIDISDKPANGVVFCVVANTDYIYEGDAQRKKHWDYRIKLGEGALATASKDCKWYFYEKTIKDNDFETSIEDVEYGDTELPRYEGVRLMSSVVKSGDIVQIDLNGANASDIKVRIVGLSGVIVESGDLNADGTFSIPAGLRKGLYFITFTNGERRDVFKVLMK